MTAEPVMLPTAAEARPATLVEVACTCPGTPHPQGDWVELYPEATIDIGAAATVAVQAYGHDPMQLQVALGRAMIVYGIRAWSYVDDRGNPVPVTPRDPGWPQVVERCLPWARGGYQVADRCDQLYAKDVLDPWLALTSKPSKPGPMAGPTSATPATGPRPLEPSAPSSRKRTGGKRSGAPAR